MTDETILIDNSFDLNSLSDGWYFWENSLPANVPTSNSNWAYLFQKTNISPGAYQTNSIQHCFTTNSHETWVRESTGATFKPWRRIITTNDEGAGNGFDADLLDGRQGSEYDDNYYPPTSSQPSDINHTIVSSTTYPHLSGFRTGSGAVSFNAAMNEAASYGARLPTIEELNAGVIQGSGFGYDSQITWSMTSAGPGQVYGMLGAGNAARVVLNTNTDTAYTGFVVNNQATSASASNLTRGTLPTGRLAGTYNISINGNATSFGGVSRPTSFGQSAYGNTPYQNLDANNLLTVGGNWWIATGTNTPSNGVYLWTPAGGDISNRGIQIAGTDPNLWFRDLNPKTWRKIWNSGNDGSASGLDADLLDGQQGSFYTNIPGRLGYTPAHVAGNSSQAFNVGNATTNSEAVAFGQLPFTQYFETAPMTITANTILTSSHPFGVKPKMIWSLLVCETAELGYSVGDETLWQFYDGTNASGSSGPQNISADTQNLYLPTGDYAPQVINKVASKFADWNAITRSNWKIVLKAAV